MSEVLLTILGGACISIMGLSLRRRDGVYHFAFLAAGVFAGFCLVQLVGLSHNDYLPPGALDKTIVMTLLCLLMVYSGARLGTRPYKAFNWRLNPQRLVISSLMLSSLGAWAFLEIRRLPDEMTSASQWTGTVVAYNFVAQSMTYGMAIAALLYVEHRSKAALLILCLDCAFYAERIFVRARRGDAAEILAIIALALWFRSRVLPPRVAVVAFVIVGTLFVYSTGDYRGLVKEESWIEEVSTIDFQDNLKQVWSGGSSEMINAVYAIEAADRNLDFDYGAFHWNVLVFNYVPAQIVGSEAKDALLVDVADDSYTILGHVPTAGSTQTGISDSFSSFWYFGAVKFFVIAYILARIYAGAVDGSTVMQLLYMLMLVNGLHAITHHTNWFVSPWVHLTVFLLPFLAFARERDRAPKQMMVTSGAEHERGEY